MSPERAGLAIVKRAANNLSACKIAFESVRLADRTRGCPLSPIEELPVSKQNIKENAYHRFLTLAPSSQQVNRPSHDSYQYLLRSSMSLNEVWVGAAGSPFLPVVAKERQFLVGFTLLLIGQSH